MSGLEDWNAQKIDRYREALELGRHDEECEQRERSSLCHCSKRRREARGLTTPPEIWHRAPQCGGCRDDLSYDGDQWHCRRCATAWDIEAEDFSAGTFTDDYGDDIGGERLGRRMLDIAMGGAGK